MDTSYLFRVVCVCMLILIPDKVSIAASPLESRMGGLAFYDPNLNITWLTDANYAKTSGYDDDGRMSWDEAQIWIGTLNAANHLGTNNWRLPTMVDTGTPGCNYSYNWTDCGFNVQTFSGTTIYSEMASLYHITLGNLSYTDIYGNPAHRCIEPDIWRPHEVGTGTGIEFT